MAGFDRTNTAHLAALQAEYINDPASIGYAGTNNTTQLLKLFNDSVNNPGNETAARIFDVFAMLDALLPSDFGLQQTNVGAANYTHTLVELAAYADIAAYKDKWKGMFPNNSTTVANLNAQTRDLSRIQALGVSNGLWDNTTVIIDTDFYAARDYVA